MISALGRSEDYVDHPNARLHLRWINGLKAIRNDLRLREIDGESTCCDAAHIDGSSDYNSRLLRAAAAAARASEEIESPWHGSLTPQTSPCL
jgi:hypothetical protein